MDDADADADADADEGVAKVRICANGSVKLGKAVVRHLHSAHT
ncbi:hypothetical protein [Streptomyces sp. NPDC000618]